MEEKSANICSDAFCICIEGINKEPLMPFFVFVMFFHGVHIDQCAMRNVSG